MSPLNRIDVQAWWGKSKEHFKPDTAAPAQREAAAVNLKWLPGTESSRGKQTKWEVTARESELLMASTPPGTF